MFIMQKQINKNKLKKLNYNSLELYKCIIINPKCHLIINVDI